MNSKSDLRIIAKNIRKNLDMEAVSVSLVTQLRDEEYYKKSKNILIFHPKKNEVNVLELLNDDKNFYLPRVEGKELVICPYCEGDKLELSSHQVYEPCTNPISPEELDLVIVPALMADSSNYRLGYGGGFYDRFLVQCPFLDTVALLPKELIVNSLPVCEFDVKVKFVIHG